MDRLNLFEAVMLGGDGGSSISVINNTTSTSTTDALSANMGKELQDQVNNLKTIGRFLAIWNSGTGMPLTNPTTLPYTYKTGDYYRVGVVAGVYTHTVTYSGIDLNDKAFSVQFVLRNDSSDILASTADIGTALYNLGYDEENQLPATGSCGADNVTGIYQEVVGAGIKLIGSDDIVGNIGQICTVTVSDTVTGGMVNYKPNGATYNGTASTTEETESVEIGWVYYYDGSQWLAQSAGSGGLVQDVQINGTSILSSDTGVANIPKASVSNLGVIGVGASFNTNVLSSGYMQAVTNTYAQYQSKGNDAFIGKGTLENVLDNESVRIDKATSLSTAQKSQARSNIGAVALEEYNSSAASYAENTLYYVVD